MKRIEGKRKSIALILGILAISTVTVIGANFPEMISEVSYEEELIIVDNLEIYDDDSDEESAERERLRWERGHAGKVKQMEMILESLNNIKDIDEATEKEIAERAKERHSTSDMPEIKGHKDKVEDIAPKKVPEVRKANKVAKDTTNMFTITAYDLSYNSCEKTMDDPWYGITANGTSLKGTTRESAMTVAADTRVIPMGSRIRLEFEHDSYQKFNGIYTVKDRGGAIKGAKIDLFMGDFNKHETDQSVWDFGRVKAKVYLIKD